MAGDILDLAADIGVVQKSGAWYAYEGNKIGQGRENAKTFLRENPEIMEEIEGKVRNHFCLDGEAAEGKEETVNTEEAKESGEE